MRRTKKRLLIFAGGIIALLLLLLAATAVAVGADRANARKIDEIKQRAYLLTDEELLERMLWFEERAAAYRAFPDGLAVHSGAETELTIDLPAAGDYELYLVYAAETTNMFPNDVTVSVDGHAIVSELPLLWVDEIDQILADRYGNEVVPSQRQLPVSCSAVKDQDSFSGLPFRFSRPAGSTTIALCPQSQDMQLYGVYALTTEPVPNYTDYREAQPAGDSATESIVIEGENYRLKSDSYLRARYVSNTGVIPQDPYVKVLNATDDKSNKTMGQQLVYEIEVPNDGYYCLTFQYSQPLKTGGNSYRTIFIDGRIPFAELRDVAFPHTGIDVYDQLTVGGDTPYQIYLSAGVHTLTVEVTATPIETIYQELLALVGELNDTGIQLKKIKGSNSDDTASIDTERTWDILQYMPDILDKLDRWQTRIDALYGELELLDGAEPSYASDLMLAAQNLRRLAEKPREIPNRMSLLSDDSSSAAQLISLVLTKLYEQNLSIDRIFLHGPMADLPSPTASPLLTVTTALKQFVYSFSEDMNEAVDVQASDGALTVWINKPSQYVDALRELTAQTFTQETGIDVIFSIMPDEKKITMANATGRNPDIALGLSYYRPAEFAMRGMALDLLQFDDFLDWYGAEYNLQSLAPMAYEDGIFGASETQDFYVLFYRTDIMEMLGLSVPDTWEDVKAMMPVLHRSAMNFNLPLANNVSYKSFEMTGGFIFQNGGDYYADDGFSANFSDPNTLAGLREMTDLYRIYGLSQNIPNFFNAFRSGSVPIGVSNFATYLQLQMGAPELNGRWDIALVPGTRQADGTICRYWSADATSAMIFSNTRMPDEAYAFLRWWLSSETQLRYAIDLQMKYGTDYTWNTANHVAFAGMSYPQAHKEIILEQWSWQKEALRHPASYILEREVSNTWIGIVTEGDGFQARIDEATLNSNREIKRKLTEFGYFDQEGNKLRDYNVHLIDELIAQQKGGEQP